MIGVPVLDAVLYCHLYGADPGFDFRPEGRLSQYLFVLSLSLFMQRRVLPFRSEFNTSQSSIQCCIGLTGVRGKAS